MIVKDYIEKRSLELEPDWIEMRRYLHANPELSFEEAKTRGYISTKLQELGIPFTYQTDNFGLVGLIEGKNPAARTIALRADMDALPLEEKNNTDYVSTVPGVMHACGHDVHMVNLLGAARILSELKNEFEGTVKLIFQPGEEKAPGGASMMIQKGVLDNPTVETIIGQHVFPELEAGKVGFKTGMYMASSDDIFITVSGKGGHGAQPHKTIDTVLIASHIIVALQQVVSRRADPIMPSVLTFGKIVGLGATNVIPNEVKIEGTFRTFDEMWRLKAKQLIKEIVEGVGKAMGAEVDIRIKQGYPYLKNEETLTKNAIDWAKDYLGSENVETVSLRMTSEDFAFYSQEIPACFYRLGTGNKMKGISSLVHTPTFDIDESALKIGVGLMAWLAYKQLEPKLLK